MLTKRMICALSALLLTLAAPAVQADAAVPGAPDDALVLDLEGDAARLDGTPVPEDDPDAAVYTAHDIVYYEAGHDFTYGEGTAADEHTPEEAAAHTVVHITQPGAYILRGVLDPGQIAVDLGEDAASDPDAVVTLVLDGADVTCTVAPAVIFYNVYECDQTEDQGAEPDLSDAGARVVIADGSENDVAGSYVARIYKSYTLSEDGRSVTDSKKLHKYDGALYSKMSMTVSGGPAGDGVLRLTAANEGLDTEMHLAVNGGVLYIDSGNDGVNCNEDGVSVITFNGGETHITVTGETGEGDGVDSNGWLVVNGGVLTAQACSSSMDSGLDSANGISIRGGTVAACGNMLDSVESTGQSCAVFTFSRRQAGGTHYVLTGADRTERICFTPDNDHTSLLLSSPALTAGEGYSLLADGAAVAVSAGGAGGGMPGAGMPGGGMPGGDMPGGGMPGTAPEPPDGNAPEPPDGAAPEPPDGTAPELPDGATPEPPDGAAGPMGQPDDAPASAGDTFALAAGMNHFRAG